jgi:ribosomal protein S18 acetylase RimI-like enzyme
MSNIKIRPANMNDAPLIAQIVAMVIGDDSATKLCGAGYPGVLEEAAAAEGTQYSYLNALVAEVDGVASGAALGYDGANLHQLREGTLAVIRNSYPSPSIPDDETAAGEFYIDSIGILPQYRNHGAGKKLLMAMVGKGLALGNDRVGLMVDFENSGAAALYERCGFKPVGEKLFYSHKMHHLQCTHLQAEEKILYTGLNYPQVKEFCGDKILAPYICMGFSMLSLIVPDGFATVNEGDTICRDGLGNLWVE